jgi:hypothetical protein
MKRAIIKSILVFLLAASIFLASCNSPLHSQNLGEYLQDLFVTNEIVLDKDEHEKVEYTCEFGEADWVHKGFNLDKEVLKKLYYENPKKVLDF